MEIFKAASAQNQTTQISNQALQTRQVEHIQTQTDSVQKNNQDQKVQDDTKLSNEEIAKQTKKATDQLNKQMEQLDTNVRFNYNDKINMMVVQVTEATTGKVIRQLPSEQAIKISEYFKESIGILFDKEI